MAGSDQLSDLVSDVYDATLDPSRWNGVLLRTRDFLGGSCASIISKDSGTRSLNVHYHCGGIDPHFEKIYIDTYAKIDPSTTAHVLARIGQMLSTVDVMPFDEWERTRFFQEWGRPQKLADFASVTLERSATGVVLIGVHRLQQQGPVDHDMRWRLLQIAPHIRRAMLIGRAIELKTAEAVTFADALDGLSAGMFLVDQNNRTVHANASGRMMLAEGAVLRRATCRLTPTDAKAAQALTEIIAAAAHSDTTVGIKGIAVPLIDRSGEAYVAHVLPLTSGERRAARASYAAVAAVFVRKAAVEAPSAPEIIAKFYNLTPTELRVLLAIVEIGGVPETAEALGIGEATVKTHLHRLFCKTGATRQADLVKLVAGFSNPLVS